MHVKAGPPIKDPAVQHAFGDMPEDARTALLTLRALIFQIASETPGVGALDETLKWGQPAYLTPETGAGTTIRLGVTKDGDHGLFVHCQSRVIPEFRALFPDAMTFDGNRGVIFAPGEAAEPEVIAPLIRAALTYRLKG